MPRKSMFASPFSPIYSKKNSVCNYTYGLYYRSFVDAVYGLYTLIGPMTDLSFEEFLIAMRNS